MAQFEEVLDGVRLALTWASPVEIQALLKGLVGERIMSEAYSKSLSLHRLTEGMAPEPVPSETACKPGSTTHRLLNQGQLNPACRESTVTDHNRTGSESVSPMDERESSRSRPKDLPVMDEHYLNRRLLSTTMASHFQCSLGLDDEVTELLTSAESAQEPVSDNERKNEGNSEDEKEWLEQVEEAARRIAVPLWQHWDRGQRMLLPLVPSMTTATSENAVTDSEAQCTVLNMEEETELASACRTLDLYADNFKCTEAEITNPNLPLDAEEGETPKGLCFSSYDSVPTTGLNTECLTIPEAARNASPVRTCVATEPHNNIAELDACWVTDWTTDRTEDLPCLTGDAQCGLPGFTEDIAHLFSSSTPKDTQTNTQEHSFYSNTDHSMALSVLENVFWAAYSTQTCSADGLDVREDKEGEERADSCWGAKMQEMDQDPFAGFDLGDLPDLTDFLNEEYLKKIMDTDVLFCDLLLNSDDEINTCKTQHSHEQALGDGGEEKLPVTGSGTSDRSQASPYPSWGDVPMPMELPSPDSHQQSPKDKPTGKTNNRRKRTRVRQSQQCTDENTPSRPKRQRAAGRTKTKEAQAVTQGSEPSPAEMAGLSTTPTRIVHLHPSIQFITIPDSPGYQVVQALRLSPPVIRLPGTPTYILVPAASPPTQSQVPPLSPVDGAEAPVQLSSSPPGSLSDTASRAMSPTCDSPLSPSNEMSTCKESPLPESPTVLDIPQVVKDYIQDAKVHMSQTCQDMEAGLSLTSHYVDVQVSQRQVLRSGKNTIKVLDKELVIMGDTDRQKSLLGWSQIFEGSNEDKPNRYILLLGNAGMGKSTLIRKLCLDWSRECFPQFDFVFLLDGKALTLPEATFSLQTLLLNLSSFVPSCLDLEAVYAQILAAPKRVLIIFDGFYELRDYETLLQPQEKDLITSLQRDSKAQTYTIRQLYFAILQRVLLPGCTLLLSTRPRGTACQLLRRTDSFLEVCGFTPTDIETYLSQYFTDPALRASALDCLKKSSYLHLLCWNPGLCQLVCSVLEQSKSSEVLPRTLTGLCHQVLQLKMEKDSETTHSKAEPQTEIPVQSVEETQTQISSSSQVKKCQNNARTKSRAQVRTRAQRARRTKKQEEEDEDEVDGEEMKHAGREVDRTEERELLSELSSLAWEGVKANSSIIPTGQTISAKLKAFGHRTGLFFSYQLRSRQVVSIGERKGGGREDKEETARGKKRKSGNKGRKDTEITDASEDHILSWANPFLQSYLAGVHLSLSRTVSDRTFLQTLPFQSCPRSRRRPQREEVMLTQRFAVGLLFHNRAEIQRLHSYTKTVFRNMVVGKQALVTKHLEDLSYTELSPAQVLEACHYVHEASSTHGDGTRDNGSTQLVAHLAVNLPEVLTFHGVPLNPTDVFVVQNVLERGGTEGRSFSLDLEDSGIQISGLRALVGLNNINTYRACIADAITLWEQLEHRGEEELRQEAVSKFKIHPLKVTQVCHVEHLAKLVNIHAHKRLSDSSSQSDSILADGVPAVTELHKLEFELGPENGPLALPKLWELLPGLPNLQHLDLENSKIGDEGAEKLADALDSLCFLEVLNLSQNCIGDKGVKKLATKLRDLPKLHCLSLYSNVISDEGAESLAAVLPHVSSLTDLDVKYNKLTDVGAQSLGGSLKNCKTMKALRMWNQCIPYGVFERLQHQDNRIVLL